MKWLVQFIKDISVGIKQILLDKIKAIPVLLVLIVFIVAWTGIIEVYEIFFGEPSDGIILILLALAAPIYILISLLYKKLITDSN